MLGEVISCLEQPEQCPKETEIRQILRNLQLIHNESPFGPVGDNQIAIKKITGGEQLPYDVYLAISPNHQNIAINQKSTPEKLIIDHQDLLSYEKSLSIKLPKKVRANRFSAVSNICREDYRSSRYDTNYSISDIAVMTGQDFSGPTTKTITPEYLVLFVGFVNLPTTRSWGQAGYFHAPAAIQSSWR